MQLNRRMFLASAAMTAGAAAVARSARAGLVLPRGEGMYFEWKKLTDGVWVCMGEGGNVMLLSAGGESVLVDAKNAGFGRELRREAAEIAGGLKMLINSHHHADHTGGNNAFVGSVEVLAHAKAAPRILGNIASYRSGFGNNVKTMEKSDKPNAKKIVEDIKGDMELVTKAGADDLAAKMWAPTQTMDESHKVISIGGEKIELHHVGPGHTDNDLIIHVPGKNLLRTGDLAFNTMWPYADTKGGFSAVGWVASCKAILGIIDEKTIVIPGHGDVGDRKIVQAQIAFFEDLIPQAEQAVAKGTTREEFVKMTPEKYKAYAAGDWIRPITLGGLYDEAAGKKK